jgi:hypothetical protein
MLVDTPVHIEELSTFIIQVEAMLNSRPLIPMSSDPSDLQAITPGHFLIGEPLVSIPEPFIEDQNVHPVMRLNFIQEKHRHFWKTWRNEYLSELQKRLKWKSENDNIVLGSLVLLADDNIHPQKWPMGRVVALHPGADGRTRAVTIKTQSGETSRAIAKIAPLPLQINYISN